MLDKAEIIKGAVILDAMYRISDLPANYDKVARLKELRQSIVNYCDNDFIYGLLDLKIKYYEEDEKHKKMQKEFDEDWNKWGHERKGKPKLLKEV